MSESDEGRWVVMDPGAPPEPMLGAEGATNGPALLRIGAFIWAIGVETAEGTIRLTKLSVLG